MGDSIASELSSVPACSGSAVEYARLKLAPLLISLDNTRRWFKSYVEDTAPTQRATRELVAHAILDLVTQNDAKTLSERAFCWPETLRCDALRLMQHAKGLGTLVQFCAAFRVLSAFGPDQVVLTDFAAHVIALNEYEEEPLLNWLKTLYPLDRVDLVVPLLRASVRREDPQYQELQRQLVMFLEARALRRTKQEQAEDDVEEEEEEEKAHIEWYAVWGPKGSELIDRLLHLIHVNVTVFAQQYEAVRERIAMESQMARALFNTH